MENDTHLPAVLSFFAPGLGQLYVGKPLKFIGFYFIWSLCILTWVDCITTGNNEIVLFWIAAVVWIISLFDAYGSHKHV